MRETSAHGLDGTRMIDGPIAFATACFIVSGERGDALKERRLSSAVLADDDRNRLLEIEFKSGAEKRQAERIGSRVSDPRSVEPYALEIGRGHLDQAALMPATLARTCHYPSPSWLPRCAAQPGTFAWLPSRRGRAAPRCPIVFSSGGNDEKRNGKAIPLYRLQSRTKPRTARGSTAGPDSGSQRRCCVHSLPPASLCTEPAIPTVSRSRQQTKSCRPWQRQDRSIPLLSCRHVKDASCTGAQISPVNERSRALEILRRDRARGVGRHPGSIPFALITAAAAGVVINWINALAASAFLLAADTPAEKFV